MTAARGGSRAGRKSGLDEAAGASKISLLDKWKWMRAVVAHPAVPREVLATAFVVADLVNDQLGYSFAGQDHIAAVVGVSKTSIVGHIQTLKAAGLLGVTRQGTKPSHYRLLYKLPTPSGGADGEEFKPSGTHGNPVEPREFKPTGTHSGSKSGQEFKSGPALSSSRLETTKPKTKRSEKPASPESRGTEARQARQADDVVRSASPAADRPRVVSHPERQDADRRWTDAVDPETAARLAKDQDGTDRLWLAISAGRFAAADVDAGIADWTRNGREEPRFWGYFERWAVRAEKQRTARGRADYEPGASTTTRLADTGPTVAIPGHETTRWPADSVTRWAARWWSDPSRWADCLGEPPSRPDPRRSPECQTAVDAGREVVVAAVAVWRADPATWDRDRLGPPPDDLGSHLGRDFGIERVTLRSGETRTVSALDRHLRVLASDFGEDEFIRHYRALPSPFDAEDCTLPPEWQIKALEYRDAKS